MSEEESQPSLVVVVGATATGKTELAIRLAESMGGEIVSADSVQVYRHFDRGSGKPSAEELSRAPHHLLDIRDPLDPLEASLWAELAEEKIVEIRARGRVPIVCGGTYLWIRALVYGLADAPPGKEEIRERHRSQAAEKGRASLHRSLAEVDPTSAERLHENDLIRVSRALEVFELTGRTLSEIQAAHGFRQARYRVSFLGVEWERPVYEERLRERVLGMLASGWEQEVEELLQRGYGDARAMAAVGYRQMREAVEATHKGEVLDEEKLAEDIVRVTRIFARRQRTWLRDLKIAYLPAGRLKDMSAVAELGRALRSH